MGGLMNYILTQHARNAMEKREISAAWLEQTMIAPQRCEPDAIDPALEHRLAVIAERDNRVLRVIVNTQAKPEKVITMYFDRKTRGHL
jgi:hypothetical protein